MKIASNAPWDFYSILQMKQQRKTNPVASSAATRLEEGNISNIRISF